MTAEIAFSRSRIARNTACLYLRQLVMTVSRLVVVRLVLRALGVDGYGMVAAVFAITAALSILDGVLYSTAQRFLSRERIRRSRQESSAAFSTVFTIAVVLGACVVLGGETAGLWFVRNRLSVPNELMGAALVIYQAGVARAVVCVLTIPFAAQICATEKMGFFAASSFFEAGLAVATAVAVGIVSSHRPESYACLSLASAVVMLGVSAWYAHRVWPEARLSFSASWRRLAEQCGYFFWSIANAIGALLTDQGVAILLNLHAGVPYNASFKVGTEVGGHLYGLYGCLQQAYFPQMVKLWVGEDRQRCWSLLVSMTRWSVVATAVFALPVAVYAEPLLRLWLGDELPPSVVSIVRCLAVCRLLEAAVDPLHSAVMSSGRIALYETGLFLTYLFGFVGAGTLLAGGFSVGTAVAALPVAMAVNLAYHVAYLRFFMGFRIRWLFARSVDMIK